MLGLVIFAKNPSVTVPLGCSALAASLQFCRYASDNRGARHGYGSGNSNLKYTYSAREELSNRYAQDYAGEQRVDSPPQRLDALYYKPNRQRHFEDYEQTWSDYPEMIMETDTKDRKAGNTISSEEPTGSNPKHEYAKNKSACTYVDPQARKFFTDSNNRAVRMAVGYNQTYNQRNNYNSSQSSMLPERQHHAYSTQRMDDEHYKSSLAKSQTLADCVMGLNNHGGLAKDRTNQETEQRASGSHKRPRRRISSSAYGSESEC